MHDKRNAVLSVMFALAMIWAVLTCVVPLAVPALESIPMLRLQQLASLACLLILGSFLLYAYWIEDKAQDRLGELTAGRYYERNGLCFMPLVRVSNTPEGEPRAEISLYYQSRFSGVCEAVIHLRPPAGAFFSHRGAKDVHVAFRCDPGAFGVIHQPVGVAAEHQGETIDVLVAAAVRWPRHRGEQVRSKPGLPIGTFDVDWALAYRQSRHELGGGIDLKDPATVHLAMPRRVLETIERAPFTHELIESGA